MIKKLRLKFIILSMASVLLVLASTIGAINIFNYSKMTNEINYSLNNVIQNGFNDDPGDMGQSDDEHPPKFNDLERSHYFIVSFNEDGSIKESNFKHILFIDEETGKDMATNIYNGSSLKGKIDNLYYKKEVNNNLTYVAFVDAKDRLDSFNNFLVSSLIISSISYVFLFALILLTSKIVFKVSEESYQKQKVFITNASHELKTPLTVISTDLEIIEMDNGKSEWTDSIKDQVNRLTKMTNQLVILSRLDEGDYSKYPFEVFSLSEVANECINIFSNSFKKEGINISSDITSDIEMNGNKNLIEELLFIFMDNALKYTSINGEFGIAINKEKNKKISLIVWNTIEEDADIDINLLFERFYRSPNAKKDGSGIGLSIAKEIINLHKGKIKVNKENNILKFVISF